MNKKIQISNWQLILLVLFCVIPTGIFFVPGKSATLIGQSSWISILTATVISAVLLYYPLAVMGMRYPGKTIIEYSQQIFGRFLGTIFGLLLIFHTFLMHVWSLNEWGEITVTIMPATPKIILIIVLSLVSVYAVYAGIEVISRAGEVIFALGLISLLIIVLASYKRIEIVNLLPLLDFRIKPFFESNVDFMNWLTTGYAFGIFSAFVIKSNDLKKIGFISIGLSGGLLTFFGVLNILVQGVSSLQISNLPMIVTAKLIDLPGFPNIELFVLVLWTAWIFLRVTLFSFVTVYCIGQLFHLHDFRYLIVIETILAIAYSLSWYNSLMEMTYYFGVSYPFYLFFQTGLPLILWVISLFRRD